MLFSDIAMIQNKKKTEDKNETNLYTVVNAGNECAEVLVVTNECVSDKCVVDPGCSYHMIPNRVWFDDFSEIGNEKVYMGNDDACDVLGIGYVKLRLSDN